MAMSREERLASNEAIFREANERMAAWEERQESDSSELYFCECADPECREKVELRRPDYERIRSDSDYFVIVPGHEVPDVETVIEVHDDWAIIQKNPDVRELVEKTDPRRL